MIRRAQQGIPELRSMIVIFDWQGNLNEGAVIGIWGGKDGQRPTDPQALLGSLRQTVKMLEMQMGTISHVTNVAAETTLAQESPRETISKASPPLPQTANERRSDGRAAHLEPGQATGPPAPEGDIDEGEDFR